LFGANIHVRRLSLIKDEDESSDTPEVKGIPTYLKNKLKDLKTE